MLRGKNVDLYRDGGVTKTFAARMAFRSASLKWKRYVFFAVLTALFFYVMITGAMSMFYAGAVIRPPQTQVVPINKNLAFPYSSVTFKSRDREGAATLYGWHFNAKKTDSALIIVHGFGSNRFPFDEQTLDLIEAIIKIDFNVLVFDLRNSGGSEPGVSAFGLHEKNDVLGAVDYMRDAGYSKIALLGVSTGANTAAMAGAASATEEIGALILDSPIVDMRLFILRLLHDLNPSLPEFPFTYAVPMMVGLYLNGDVLDANLNKNLYLNAEMQKPETQKPETQKPGAKKPEEKNPEAKKPETKKTESNKGPGVFLPRPVQLIYGSNDEIVSLDEITSLYDGYMSRAVGQISIWNVPGATHGECYFYAKDEYIERVTAFLRRVFNQ